MTYHWDLPGGPVGFPSGSDSKASICNAGDPSSVPNSGRSPGEGHGNSPQYACLGNPMNRGAWYAMVHRITESQTQLSNKHTECLITNRFYKKQHNWSLIMMHVYYSNCDLYTEELAAKAVHYTTTHSWAILVTWTLNCFVEGLVLF